MRVGGRLAQFGTPQQVLDEPADAFVEGFVGKDRGYRSLSFLPANNLELERVKVVRDVESAEAGEPTLVIDEDARPVGWANPDRPGQVFPLGSTFNAESDTLRTALDSALTSLYGLAVAVAPETGRFAGVASAKKILEQVADARAAVAESISVRAAEETMRRSRPQPPPDDDDKATKSPADEAEGKRDAKADEGPAAVRPETVEGRDADGAAGSTAPATKVESAAEAEPQESEPAGGDKQTVTAAAAGEPVPAVGDDSKADSTVKPEADSETKAPEPVEEAAAEASAGSTETTAAPADQRPEPAADADREATIVTVVSGEPVDLGAAEAAATAADRADDAGQRPADAELADPAGERERDRVR